MNILFDLIGYWSAVTAIVFPVAVSILLLLHTIFVWLLLPAPKESKTADRIREWVMVYEYDDNHNDWRQKFFGRRLNIHPVYLWVLVVIGCVVAVLMMSVSYDDINAVELVHALAQLLSPLMSIVAALAVPIVLLRYGVRAIIRLLDFKDKIEKSMISESNS